MDWRPLALIVLVNYAFFLYYDKRFKQEKEHFADKAEKKCLTVFEKTKQLMGAQQSFLQLVFDNQQEMLEKIHNLEEQAAIINQLTRDIVSIGDRLNDMKKETRKK